MKMITYYGATDTGKVRDLNEDTFITQYLWDERHVLCAAIDGLGGYEGGEVASALARDTIVDYMMTHRNGNCLDLLKQAVTEANNCIVEHQQTTPNCNRMGCVLTAGLFEVDTMRLYVAHVGDSRMYRWRNGRLDKLTHDHSLVGYREDNGELTEEEAMNHPQRNIVERILGDKMHMLEDKNFIEASTEQVFPGDCFIFCSDGLSDMITSAEISSIIARQRSTGLEAIAKGLIEAALASGGKDNVTVVVAMAKDDEADAKEKARYRGQVADAPSEVRNPDATPATISPADITTIADDDAPKQEPRHKRRWWPLAAAALAALVVGAGAFFGGMKLEANRQKGIMTDSLQAKNIIIGALTDKLNSQQDSIEVLNDSISHIIQKAKRQSKLDKQSLFEYIQDCLKKAEENATQTH